MRNGLRLDAARVDTAVMRQSPVQADITVTALHYLIYDSGVNPETKSEWKLDGKSWLIIPTAIDDLGADDNLSILPNTTTGVLTVSGLPLNTPVEIFC